jgi:hypothetical protein
MDQIQCGDQLLAQRGIYWKEIEQLERQKGEQSRGDWY